MIENKSLHRILGGVLAVLVCGSAAAAGEPGENFVSRVDRLVGIVNDRNAAVDELSFVLDAGGRVTDVLYITSEKGQVTGKKSFPIALLATPDGAVLEEERGVKALSLHGSVDSQSGQANLGIRFVVNGVTGEYKTCAMLGVRKDGAWRLVHSRSMKPISQAKMLTWALGIKTIEGICPAD